MRDQAQYYENANCNVLGISFDTAEENAAFRAKFDFPFPLLCDTEKSVGALYEAVRYPEDDYADFPKRISYLIDPDGVIRQTYEVDDPGGHAETVLADLAAEQR